jgi:hypothetical protein
MKFLDKLNNVLDKLYTNQESMIYFYIALGALAAILILLIIITSIRIKKTQKKINKSDEVVVETGTPKTEETPEVKLETTEVKKEEPVINEVPTTEPIKEEIKEEEPAYKSEVTIKQEETPTEVQTENTVEPVIEPVIEPVVETVKEEPVVPVTEELPEIELPKITETSEDEISKLINSNEEPEVITDAPISDLPIEEPKPEEPKLEQTQTLDDLRNRLNNIRHK